MASTAEILGPMNKHQVVESSQRSIAASIFPDASSTTALQLLMNKANHVAGRQGPQPLLGGLLAGRPSLFLTPGGTPASAIDLLRQRDEVFSMIEDMSKPNANNSGDKPYRCTVLGCDKSYKNPNGLKYHSLHGHCSFS
ncbi:Transcriptional regulator of ribosomal biogenesis proteins [Podila minutissima]|uniref:Transcriptional regulator of ribosomal biogenesis proteins n=1 Tax=Podila minutissima TaxID=64525 RepID=A0A9P5SGF4_9FUNG|nr:Transcriptional regulator of ribosomal biogenesis proteins [Podila minutissima]